MAKATNRPQQVRELLAWMQVNMPRVYQGVARRFVPAGELGGLWDTIASVGGKVAGAVNNFVGSEGFDKLLNVASPFLQSEIEKQQLKLNIKRAEQGLPLQTYQPAYTTPAQQQPSATWPYDGSAMPYTPKQEMPWAWIAGGVGAGLLLMSLMGGRRR